MGKKAKTSRKNKKAWRKNIATDDIDEFIEKSTKDALSGGSLEAVPSESLFYVDKSTVSDLAAKKKIDKHREKVLRCDSLLQRNPFVKPVPSSIRKKSIRKLKEALKATKHEKQDDPKKDSTSRIVDLWAEDKVTESAQADKSMDFLPAPEIPQFNKKSKPSVIPAVEIEPPGCSFNPSFEDHQDSLAVAVAEEMQKIYQSELGPQPVPLTVTGEVVDEEDMYFLDADGGSDSDVEEDSMGIDSDLPSEQRSSKKRRVTRVEHNRRARRKEVLKAEVEAKKLGKLSKDLNSVDNIMKEIEEEEAEKQKRHDRRVIAKQERLKSAPPRLGKHKFEPAPVQVLLTEEISGSLRKLKGCSTLTSDRFKSLEKRGMVVPSAKRKR